MTDYLGCEDDGLLLRPVGRWTIEKLYYLEQYLDIFTTSMSVKPWRSINFIDLFSGPGKNTVDNTNQVILGSPIIAQRTNKPFTHFFFNDFDKLSSSALAERCSHSPYSKNIRIWNGDANVVVDDVVRNIMKFDQEKIVGSWPSLNLAFLDPEGLELQWKTVEALAKVKKMDLIIYYSQMGLTRNLLNQYMTQRESRFDLFFGTSDWRRTFEKYSAGEEMFINHELLKLYAKRLENLGYAEVHIEDSPLIRSKDKNAPLYRLIFASKNPLGNKFWKEVVKRDVNGQLKLC